VPADGPKAGAGGGQWCNLRPVSELVHRDVTASGVRVRVAESGSGANVLLLHGLFLDHSTWDGMRPSLESEFHLVTPDFPGFGESEKPPPSRFPYGIEAFAETIADLYAGLELGRAAVIGHCLGGAVALTLAARHPELVSKLVLVGPLCEPPRRGTFGSLSLLPLVGGFVFKQLWSRRVFASFFREQMVSHPSRIPPQRIDAYYETFSTPEARGSALATLRALEDTRPIVARTHGVRAPTLVVWGRSDRVVRARLGQQLAREIPGAGFELLDAGHAPQEEIPDELSQTVLRFLRR
jgi:pimeloyl-ACP methyl ester carboxylesterase